ncbi:hypothetical protein LQ938_01520 [Microbacterium sp. cx-55]|uniref:hypothetical protein n=1 Tax=Microbacterium sp. cx-55 TaxID=2875948 RepID=UPI001CC1BB4A|nr:hypothetical protein [Microbacterium sp. cx-55]MBZ4487483.1 hypothetical protein [Microbacterium sp. cx-55]UGB35503.1 hypothetical protein LQ938_01520 [Microbacterium sp. cx-55]
MSVAALAGRTRTALSDVVDIGAMVVSGVVMVGIFLASQVVREVADSAERHRVPAVSAGS